MISTARKFLWTFATSASSSASLISEYVPRMVRLYSSVQRQILLTETPTSFVISGAVNWALIKYSSCWCGMSNWGLPTLPSTIRHGWKIKGGAGMLLSTTCLILNRLLQIEGVPPSLNHLTLHILPLPVSPCTLAPLSLLKHLLHH